MRPLLRPYQRDGVAFIVRNLREPGVRAVLLCDDPGVGKTLQAIEAADQLRCRRILVIAPAMGRVSWPIEIEKHAPQWASRTKVPTDANSAPGSWLNRPDLILVLSYDVFSQPELRDRWLPALLAVQWDLLILDECHYLKGASNRTHAIYGQRGQREGLQAVCDKVLLLTGTPAPNHAGEMWQHVRTFWHDLVPYDEASFQERYTKYRDGPYGRQITGSINQDSLRKKLAGRVLRRTRETVLPQLPPLTVMDVPLMGARGDKALSLPARSTANTLMGMAPDQMLRALRQPGTEGFDDGAVATLRRELGEAKAEAAAAWIIERLVGGQPKVLVFAWHRSVIATLARALGDYGVVVVTGQTGTSERRDICDAFQTDPGVRVFIGQTLAAGVAVTLTAASLVVMVEASWTPGENTQAVARAWRSGQDHPVTAAYLAAPGGLDARIMSTFRRKAEEVAELVHEHPEQTIHA